MVILGKALSGGGESVLSKPINATASLSKGYQ
jgi:hypothetical protein